VDKKKAASWQPSFQQRPIVLVGRKLWKPDLYQTDFAGVAAEGQVAELQALDVGY
jgi:hypothetical protein